MKAKIKNIIIILVVLVVLLLVYFLFLKKSPEQGNLVSTSNQVIPVEKSTDDASLNQDFLSVLLNVKNIKLNDSIFSDSAFSTFRDSSIELTPDNNEGRPNPFAPIGSDMVASPVNTVSNLLPDNTPVELSPSGAEGKVDVLNNLGATGNSSPQGSSETLNSLGSVPPAGATGQGENPAPAN